MYPAYWITEWFWEPDRKPWPLPEGTIVFFDCDADASGIPVVVGFVQWKLRKERVEGPKEYVGEIALMFIAPSYRGQKTTQGPSIASTMLATAEAAIRVLPDTTDDTPLRIDVNIGNDYARGIYVNHWGFTHWKWRPETAS